MLATQLLTQQGGWPNSVFLTHELEPFYAGTYFPPEDRWGRPGFPRLLRVIREAWTESRQELVDQAHGLAAAIRRHLSDTPGSDSLPDRGVGESMQAGARAALRPAVGWLRRRAEVPLAGQPVLPARPRRPRPRGPAHAGDDPRPHGARRPDGPAGGRLPPLLDRRALAGAALREDALRQRLAGPALRRGRGPFRARRLRAGGAPDARLRAGRADRPAGGLPLGHRRGDRRPRGGLLRLDRRGAASRCSRPRRASCWRRSTASTARPPSRGASYVLHLPGPLAEQAARLGLSEAELLQRARAGPGRRRCWPRARGARAR